MVRILNIKNIKIIGILQHFVPSGSGYFLANYVFLIWPYLTYVRLFYCKKYWTIHLSTSDLYFRNIHDESHTELRISTKYESGRKTEKVRTFPFRDMRASTLLYNKFLLFYYLSVIDKYGNRQTGKYFDTQLYRKKERKVRNK